MKYLLKKIYNYLFYKLFDYNNLSYSMIQLKINENKVNDCIRNVIMQDKSQFYHEASVINMQNNPNKINIGFNTHIRGTLFIFANGGKIEIGDNCYIGDNTRIWSASNIKIGNDVLISHNCNIIDTNSHETDYLERAEEYKKLLIVGHPKTQNNVISKPIVIEDNVWISFNVIILKGVTIGKGAIVGAGSVVTKDIPPFVLVVGNPAKIVKYLD